ncbi:MAG: D-aminoacyl-tRNA deacylase [Candidatus Binatia bacterium]
MRLLLQRVKRAEVSIDGAEISNIGPGLCLFVGISKGDTIENADYLAEKTINLRIFEDEAGKFNRSILEINGEILIVSEFTLYGDCSKGRRPSFNQAAPPDEAEMLYNYFVQKVKDFGLNVATGKFQEKMDVSILNDGPVTFILDSV